MMLSCLLKFSSFFFLHTFGRAYLFQARRLHESCMFPEFVYTFIWGECYIILFQLDLSYQVLFLKLVIGLYPNLEINLLYG